MDLLTHSIHVPNEAHIGLDKSILGVGVQILALNGDTIGSLLRATDVVDARLACEAGEFFEGVFADAAGAADENCDEARGEGGGDASVGGLDGR